MLDLAADDAFNRLYNGAFIMESLPSALWCLLRFRDEPEEMLVTAASGGHDSDTVASMVGAYAGALHGEEAFPARWRDDLEYYDELRALGDAIAGLAAGNEKT